MTDYAGYGIPEGPQGPIITPLGELMAPAGSLFTKRVFEDILNNHGIWMVYIRSNNAFPCPRCRPDQARPGEGDGDCPVCLGLGYRATIERVRAVLSKGRRTITRDADQIPGAFGDTRHRIFFSTAAKPASNDVILEVTWNVPPKSTGFAGEPVEILHIYSIEQIEAFYHDGAPIYMMSSLDNLDNHLAPLKKALAERRR